MNIGIIGSEAAKFTPETAETCQDRLSEIICHYADNITVVSGHCHLGGVDIWAEKMADDLHVGKLIFPPKRQAWEGGYKQRNIQIAVASDKIFVITVKELPPTYTRMRFKGCYHCDRRKTDERIELAQNFRFEHIKSGACWTAWYAIEKLGKPAEWIII